MAKKESKPSSRRFLFIVLLLILIAGGWWAWQSPVLSNWKDQLLQYIDNRDISTLEARYLPEQIIEMHRQELLSHDKRTLQNTTLKYYPYLLLDVKYSESNRTREGVLLWGLNDGEMVLNTETWEITHGFKDCLECQATRSDFKILQALARRQEMMTIEELQKELHVEREVLNSWIEGAKQKHLIVQKGNLLQLHFEDPKLLVTPQTKIKQHLVSKPLGEGQKVARTYSRNQIMDITQAAFGSDFKIRSEQEIFLPVYSFEILNPDGSVQISEWNALTGQRILPHYLSQNLTRFKNMGH
jgi:hypothetical protein